MFSINDDPAFVVRATVANTTSLLKQKLSAKNHSDLIRIAVEMNLG
jgi:hypothetical protein